MTVDGLAAGDAGQTYAQARPLLEAALRSYEGRLSTSVASVAGDHYIAGRVKSARSLIRKLRRNPSEPREWTSITDKVGLRVICSTKRDCKRIDAAIAAEGWRVVDRERKSGQHDQLYYPGIHYLVDDGVSRDHLGEPILCEVQVRTRAQDAWSVVSHKLLYKGVIDPPRRMKRVINRLTVVVEMFDDEVQRMFKRREKLPMYRTALALEFLEDQFEEIVGEPSDGPADLDVMNIILNAYSGEDRNNFSAIVAQYCEANLNTLRTQISAHQPGSHDYMDARDWLFTQPEIIAILERAQNREYLLQSAIEGTDLEESVRKACSAVGVVLPTSA